MPAGELREELRLSRARICQLVVPLIKQGLIKRAGRARATLYQLTEHRSAEQIRRENWELRQKIKELEKQVEDRKVIERAKEILMAEFDILPTEAYRKLQEKSMAKGRTMSATARIILSAYEVEA